MPGCGLGMKMKPGSLEGRCTSSVYASCFLLLHVYSVQERKEMEDGKNAFVISRQDNAELTAVMDEDLCLCNVFEDGTLSDVTDLTYLTHLHEPAVLEALCLRFADVKIYTNTGPILLAVNPFKQVPGLYTKQLLEMYYSTGILKSQNVEAPKLPPHVYATADNAYRALVDSGLLFE